MSQLPNILWVVFDALRWDHLSCYGHHRQTTPNIDRLATEGARYMRAFTQGHYSLPSHTTMLTGLYPHEHRVERPNHVLDKSVVSLPSRLNAIGYETICISANHYVGPANGLSRDFNQYFNSEPRARRNNTWNRLLECTGLTDQGARDANHLAMGAIDSCTVPWFMCLVSTETHTPYSPPLGFIGRYHNGMLARVAHPLFTLWAGSLKRLAWVGSERAWHWARALYDAEIAYADYRLGELVGFMANRGILDETIVIITADHGDFLGEQGLGGHAFGIGEALLHVPLVLRFPSGVPPGTVAAQVVELRDIPYTVMKMLGAQLHTTSVYSARNLLAPSPADRAFAYTRRTQMDERGKVQFRKRKWARRFLRHDRDVHILRTAQWQFRLYDNGARALYDVEGDPAEENEVSAQHPDILDELHGKLEDFLAGHQAAVEGRTIWLQ